MGRPNRLTSKISIALLYSCLVYLLIRCIPLESNLDGRSLALMLINSRLLANVNAKAQAEAEAQANINANITTK